MKTQSIRISLLLAALALCTPSVSMATCLKRLDGRLQDYSGTIAGKYKINLSIVSRDDTLKGEYFYHSQLKDIALRVTSTGDTIAMAELNAEGVTVAHFTGTLADNCSTIAGSWQKAGSAEKLPFSLASEGSPTGSLGHRYWVAGSESDATVHANAYKFWLGVKNGDKKSVASVIAYPLEVKSAGKTRRFRNAKEFTGSYDTIFIPAFRKTILDAVPHNMDASMYGIGLGGSAVWMNHLGQPVKLTH